MRNENKYPILSTYRILKNTFGFEPYLEMIHKDKFRIAMSRFRASSHILEIERGRYTSPITPREQRKCPQCTNLVEDENHFMLVCELYHNERRALFSKINGINPDFLLYSSADKFLYIFNNNNEHIMSWVGSYIHQCMNKRTEITLR